MGAGSRRPDENLRRIPIPTLLIIGEADEFVRWGQMSEMLIINYAEMEDRADHISSGEVNAVVGPINLALPGRHVRTTAPALGSGSCSSVFSSRIVSREAQDQRLWFYLCR